MPELNKGFVPFSYVDEEKIYDNEVGNDYNPHGWNTATAMCYTSGTVTANGEVINVIKPTVDVKVNWDGFVDGIWNKIETGEGTGTAVPPIVKPIIISTPEVIDKDNTEIKDFTVTVDVEKGSEDLDNIKFELVAGDTIIMTQTVQDPEPGTLEFSVPDDVMNQIEQSGITVITLVITASDGTQITTSKKDIQFVHQIIYGISNKRIPSEVPAIIESTTDPFKIQKRTVGYDGTTLFVSPFYPTGDWAFMYIAVPKEWGKIVGINSGALSGGGISYEISSEEWYPYSCKINGIDYLLYVLQYNNEGTFEFTISVEKQ